MQKKKKERKVKKKKKKDERKEQKEKKNVTRQSILGKKTKEETNNIEGYGKDSYASDKSTVWKLIIAML